MSCVEKISTRINGLDLVLNGGIPKKRVTAIVGGTGTGKSVLSAEIAIRNAVEGESVLCCSFEQAKGDYLTDMSGFDWPVEEMVEYGKLTVFTANIDQTELIGDPEILDNLFETLKIIVSEKDISILVLDAIEVLINYLPEDNYLKPFRVFCEKLRTLSVSTIITIKEISKHVEYEYIADCLIYLAQDVERQISTRILRVKKYRGSAFSPNKHSYVISGNGIRLLPLARETLSHRALGGRLSTGVVKFDKMLGGGFRRASSVLISGTPGTAKTSLAGLFAKAQCEAGETVLYIDFEQSTPAMTTNLLSIGVDLTGYLKDGSFVHMSQLPESKGVEEHLFSALDAIEKHSPKHVILDALSACERMGSKKTAYDYALRVINHCKSQGITVLMLNQTKQALEQELSGVEISSMIDTVILLSMFTSGNEVNRLLLIVKSRGSSHSNQYREFVLTDNGITILSSLSGAFDEIVTGTRRRILEGEYIASRESKLNRKSSLEKELQELGLEIEKEDLIRANRTFMDSDNI
ncbi:MAG: hypothetical protein MI749_06750 [Desulfovibrionales bacterium]|nr:hypothetical protein [Desulfovibrionales bacterium]